MTNVGSGLNARTAMKASVQNRRVLQVRTALQSGGIATQHNRRVLKVRTAVKAGGLSIQHNRRVLTVRTG